MNFDNNGRYVSLLSLSQSPAYDDTTKFRQSTPFLPIHMAVKQSNVKLLV